RSEFEGNPVAVPQIPFELPQGLAAEVGQVYRQGHMRLATGEDELLSQQSAQLLDSSAYGILVRLSRVIVLTGCPALTADDLGNLFMPDIHYLIETYNALNSPEYRLSLSGESRAIP
ncbi:MAG: hypothetical protein ICV77_18470, partial [Cyanobacteria bacterium Co-bin8]|nr:hypothetical protein [Cyanobacteria bacterium Co-bin8]